VPDHWTRTKHGIVVSPFTRRSAVGFDEYQQPDAADDGVDSRLTTDDCNLIFKRRPADVQCVSGVAHRGKYEA